MARKVDENVSVFGVTIFFFARVMQFVLPWAAVNGTFHSVSANASTREVIFE